MNLNFLKVGKKGPARTAAGGAGFNLIELLVVIAIIGILSGIVLTSLGTARAKARDAAIKANLSGMRAQAELINDDNNGHYGVETNPAGVNCTGGGAGVLFTNATIAAAIVQAESSNGAAAVKCVASDGLAALGGNASSWAMSSALSTNATQFFCVDSGGKAVTTATDLVAGGGLTAAATACP